MARRAVAAVGEPSASDELIETIARFYDDPLGFVLFAYPWGEADGPLADEVGPDVWQSDFLVDLGQAVRDRVRAPDLGAYLAAVASGHGVGKTALVSWVIDWFMSTRPNAVIVCTANTAGQLEQTTWRELSKWHQLSINADWFAWTATTFYFKAQPATWKAVAVPWSKERSEGFAGKHEKHVLMLFDEASAIDDVIWETSEGVLTTAGAIWLAFGNPTRNTGRFRECWRRFRHRWRTYEVDSRTAKKANQGQIQKWIDDWGEDSDFVRVRVRGMFPRAASLQLISGDLVEASQREYKRRFGDQIAKALSMGGEDLKKIALDDNPTAAWQLSVDVARFGGDQTVIGLRVGMTFVVLQKLRDLDGPQVAYRVVEWIKLLEPDVTLVDAVGVGSSVYDTLRDIGYEPIAVNNGLKALDERKFFNRRAEVWWKMKEWLAGGGRIPDDDRELMDDLTAPEYGYSDRGERVQIESKDDMRSRGLPSPDTADCLSQTFFLPVAPSRRRAAITSKLMKVMRAMRQPSGTTWMSN